MFSELGKGDSRDLSKGILGGAGKFAYEEKDEEGVQGVRVFLLFLRWARLQPPKKGKRGLA